MTTQKKKINNVNAHCAANITVQMRSQHLLNLTLTTIDTKHTNVSTVTYNPSIRDIKDKNSGRFIFEQTNKLFLCHETALFTCHCFVLQRVFHYPDR